MIEIKAETQENGKTKVYLSQKDGNTAEAIAIIIEMLNEFGTGAEKMAACATAFELSLDRDSQGYIKKDDCLIDQNLINIMKNFKGDQMD